ncbi:MAG: PrsW family intramembrane metalloprotease, partial [Nocardioidaceae bacterium]
MAVAVVIGLASAGCVWGLHHELDRAMGPAALGWGALFSLTPALPLVALFWWVGTPQREPRWLLLVAVLWGGLAATYIALKLNAWLAIQVGDVYQASARSAVFVAPWVEEAAKGTIIFAIVLWRKHDFNAVVAGVVYGGLVGTAFAFTENLVYYGPLFQEWHDAKGTGAALSA